ncbi:MAG: GTP-binding protein [Candidatus Thorarchaeota archaeon]|nr:GTP-binding protein [Candidatus Thorarchaeota archaeon]MCK5238014.1 GTP-binding protein [Candidatus Thorarchaeota archaeon]
MSPTYLLKTVIVGSGSVGKTSMILRYSTGAFREHYSPTLGTGFAYKKLKLGDDFATLQIWDMGSQDFLERVRANYYVGSHAVVFMFDVTSTESMDEVLKWKEEVDRHLSDYTSLLVGNKTDLVMDRTISEEDAKKMAEQLGMDYMETSVKLDKNVNEVFVRTTRNIITHFF